jgi:His-Xaa-Ser system radical SAM maturase HxsC
MRKSRIDVKNLDQRQVFRVCEIGTLEQEWVSDINFLIPIRTIADESTVNNLITHGLHNLTPIYGNSAEAYDQAHQLTGSLQDFHAGDVVALTPSRNMVTTLFRESDQHHSIFITNQCNSLCLMCSQPPTTQDDSWLINEAMQLIRHIKTSPISIGLTGGEPLLRGKSIRLLVEMIAEHHPSTHINILTNGRLLAEEAFSSDLLSNLNVPVSWLVPLYGHADFLHDFIVQKPKAFEETLAGLLNLQKYHQTIQIRIVLIAHLLPYLTDLCEFITRNIPFATEVVLMGCEPTGFALANAEICFTDIRVWNPTLLKAIQTLEQGNIPVKIMNVPLCALESTLWKYAIQSISDWKRVFTTECECCEVKDSCCGLFAWHEKGWKPTILKALKRNGELV